MVGGIEGVRDFERKVGGFDYSVINRGNS